VVPFYRKYRRPAYLSGMAKQIQVFLKDESGAAAKEYSVVAVGIVLAILPVVTTGTGIHLKGIFSSISTTVK
jgi:Flp pilus assembly pilin Flp